MDLDVVVAVDGVGKKPTTTTTTTTFTTTSTFGKANPSPTRAARETFARVGL